MTNTTEKKMTRKDYFARIQEIVNAAGVADVAELNEFIDKQVAQLTRKPSASSKSKNEAEINATKNEIVAVLGQASAPMSIAQMQVVSSMLAEMTNQKISSRLKGLCDTGVVVRTKDKRISVFSLA